MKKLLLMASVFLAALFAVVSAADCRAVEHAATTDLTGAWRGKVQGKSGVVATLKGLEFLYVFNTGGTMTESSNYDASPPGPPAYGVWRKTGPRQFEAKYEFFTNSPPANVDEIPKGGGWAPAGHGVLTEKITLSEDGNAFASTIRLELFGQQGKPVEGGGDATGQAERIKF